MIRALAFSSNSKRIVSASYDGTVVLWDTQNAEHVRTNLIFHTQAPAICVAFTPDDKLIVCGTVDGAVQIFDISTGHVVQRFKVPLNFRYSMAVAFSPDGRLLSVSTGTIQVWDWKTGQSIWRSNYIGEGSCLVFSNDSKKLLSQSSNPDTGRGVLKIWYARSGQLMHTLSGAKSIVKSVAFGSDLSVVTGVNEMGIKKQWDIGTGLPIAASIRRIADLTLGNTVVAVAISPHYIAIAISDGSVELSEKKRSEFSSQG